MRIFHTGCCLGFAGWIALAGCIEIVEPAPPAIDAGTGSSCPGICDCSSGNMAGRAYRITKLAVKEPPQLSETLDPQWAGELSNYLLNVVFMVNNVENSPESSAAFSKINITAGSGWRAPDLPYQVDSNFEPDAFCFMSDDLNTNVDVVPKEGAQCVFENEMSVNLPFHLGSTADPLMCAPQLTPANSTPIMDLTFEFGFNGDCSAIISGYLSGCIPQDSANRICLCTTASLCSKDNAALDTPFPENFTDTKELRDYCRTTCGQGGSPTWASFREVLDLNAGGTDTEMPLTCELLDGGAPGYRLSARFEAEEITEKLVSNFNGSCVVQ